MSFIYMSAKFNQIECPILNFFYYFCVNYNLVPNSAKYCRI